MRLTFETGERVRALITGSGETPWQSIAEALQHRDWEFAARVAAYYHFKKLAPTGHLLVAALEGCGCPEDLRLAARILREMNGGIASPEVGAGSAGPVVPSKPEMTPELRQIISADQQRAEEDAARALAAVREGAHDVAFELIHRHRGSMNLVPELKRAGHELYRATPYFRQTEILSYGYGAGNIGAAWIPGAGVVLKPFTGRGFGPRGIDAAKLVPPATTAAAVKEVGPGEVVTLELAGAVGAGRGGGGGAGGGGEMVNGVGPGLALRLRGRRNPHAFRNKGPYLELVRVG